MHIAELVTLSSRRIREWAVTMLYRYRYRWQCGDPQGRGLMRGLLQEMDPHVPSLKGFHIGMMEDVEADWGDADVASQGIVFDLGFDEAPSYCPLFSVSLRGASITKLLSTSSVLFFGLKTDSNVSPVVGCDVDANGTPKQLHWSIWV